MHPATLIRRCPRNGCWLLSVGCCCWQFLRQWFQARWHQLHVQQRPVRNTMHAEPQLYNSFAAASQRMSVPWETAAQLVEMEPPKALPADTNRRTGDFCGSAAMIVGRGSIGGEQATLTGSKAAAPPAEYCLAGEQTRRIPVSAAAVPVECRRWSCPPPACAPWRPALPPPAAACPARAR